MDDEARLSETDGRVRAALAADPEATRRVLTAALGARSNQSWRRPYAIAGAAALCGLGAAAWLWHATGPPSSAMPPLTVTGHGRLIVVESQDGRRWIVGPSPPPRAAGSYVIVVPQ
jgi:hypothetical protein